MNWHEKGREAATRYLAGKFRETGADAARRALSSQMDLRADMKRALADQIDVALWSARQVLDMENDGLAEVKLGTVVRRMVRAFTAGVVERLQEIAGVSPPPPTGRFREAILRGIRASEEADRKRST